MKASYLHVLEMCVIYLHEAHIHKLKCQSGHNKIIVYVEFPPAFLKY